MDKYIVIVYSSDSQLSAMGTKTGRLFGTKVSADRMARRVERDHPLFRTVVLKLEAAP